MGGFDSHTPPPYGRSTSAPRLVRPMGGLAMVNGPGLHRAEGAASYGRATDRAARRRGVGWSDKRHDLVQYLEGNGLQRLSTYPPGPQALDLRECPAQAGGQAPPTIRPDHGERNLQCRRLRWAGGPGTIATVRGCAAALPSRTVGSSGSWPRVVASRSGRSG